ncbi:MAG TPA: PP2C family protein-serine/threonine phosphatase [Sorangium sp.]|nr:PP2C family protein-serine/threonine phosphatase [Sorangium sp.]
MTPTERLVNPRSEALPAPEVVARSHPEVDAETRRSPRPPAARHGEQTAALAAVLHDLSAKLDELTATRNALAALKMRLDNELCDAHDVQVGLLPKILPCCPEHDELEVFGMVAPARGVGGDLYDFFWIDEHRFFFMIGDVSEKGVPAALLMAVIKTLMSSHVPSSAGLCEALAVVNDRLAESNDALMFVTAFCGILDVRSRELEYCDGGHNVPWLLPREAPATLVVKRTGIALGIERGFRFQSSKITLRPGDGIFLYTDGVTEAMNAERGLYTEERLRGTLDRTSGNPLRDLVQEVLEDVQRFAGSAPQSDDIAMLAVRLRSEAPGEGETR